MPRWGAESSGVLTKLEYTWLVEGERPLRGVLGLNLAILSMQLG